MLMKIHHYGLATTDIQQSVKIFSLFGYKISDPIFDPIQKVKAVFILREGEIPIEIICDSETDGPTSGFIAKVGSGLYHICYEVEEIEDTIKK